MNNNRSLVEQPMEPFYDLSAWFNFLREHNFDVSVRRQTTVGRWLLQQVGTGLLKTADQHDQRWMDDLAPLICRDSNEQIRYQQLTQVWCSHDRGKIANPIRVEALTVQPTPEIPGRRSWWWTRVSAGLLLALVLSWLITVFYSAEYCNSVAHSLICSGRHTQDVQSVRETTESGKPIPSVKSPQASWTKVVLPLTTQPPIDLSLVTNIEEAAERHWGWWFFALALLPIAPISAYLLWRRRSDVIHHSQGAEPDEMQRDALRLAELGALFNTIDADTVMRALNRPIPSSMLRSDIDAIASMHETVRSGIPRLVHNVSSSLPEIVVLVQISSASDLCKSLAGRLKARLQRNGLRCSIYFFSAQPTSLLKLGEEQGERCSPTILRRRHPDARLLVLCEPSLEYDLCASQLFDWMSTLAAWQTPLANMTLEPFSASFSRQLCEDGLQLLPLDVVGLQGLLTSHRFAQNTARKLPLPLQNAEWPCQSDQAQDLYGQLSQFMGQRGMRLLQVLALYPELYLGLVVALDKQMFADSDGPSRQRRLYRLLQLPWARNGWLPERLRLQLLAAQSTLQRADASEQYKHLFERLGASGELSLPFTHPDRWTALRLFLGLRGPGERDLLFLSQVVGPRWLNKLAFYLPKTGRIFARLGRHYLAISAAFCLLSVIPSIWLFFDPPKVDSKGPLDISIASSELNSGIKSRISDWLKTNGADVYENDNPKLEQGITLRVTSALNPLARQLAEQLRRMPDAQPVSVQLDDELGDKLIIEIGEPAEQFIGVYRDRFNTQDQANDVLSEFAPGIQMVAIPAGTFLMGSPKNEIGRDNDEGPQRVVAIQAFELSDTEVTFEQYDLFASETEREQSGDKGWGRGDRPVINVSWNDAVAYITWLNEKTASNFRLPNEAEWEYAARAGTITPFYSGNCISTKQANYDGNHEYDKCGANTGQYLDSTSAVKTYGANPRGLHDMSGNVWEWTQDCWHDNYTGAPIDGSAWLEDNGGDCDLRVLRGGSWNNFPVDLRSASRYWFNLDFAYLNVGFRLARTP